MTQPTPTFGAAPPVARLAEALRVDEPAIAGTPQRVAVGVAWHIVPLDGVSRVRTLEPDMDSLARLERETGVAVTVFSLEAVDPDCRVRVRSFAPGDGIPEDPVCGSGNGCVAAYLAQSGRLEPPFSYTAEQGEEVGRPGRVQVRVDRHDADWRVRVGGRVVTLLCGELSLP